MKSKIIKQRSKSIFAMLVMGILFFGCEPLETDQGAAIEGLWSVKESAGAYNVNYEIAISTDQNDSTIVYFYNFLNLGTAPTNTQPKYRLIGKLSGKNLSFSRQVIDEHTLYEGSGVISDNNNSISLSYKYSRPGEENYETFNATSQLTRVK